MFNLPVRTEINKVIFKKSLFQKFSKELSGNKKMNFDKDIKKLTIINEISEESVQIKSTEDISSIFLILVELKSKKINDENLKLISKLLGQKILLILKYENEFRLAIYETTLLFSDWKAEVDIKLNIQGLDLSQVWINFITQVADIKIEQGNTLAEQIEIENRKRKIIKQIEIIENKARKEPQSKKKFELFQQLKAYEKELEKM